MARFLADRLCEPGAESGRMMPARISATAIVFLALLFGTKAIAQNQMSSVASPTPSPSPRAIVLGGHYVAEFAGNSSGGLSLGTAYASELMVSGPFDLARLAGPGLGTARIILTAREGSSLSANAIGNIFTVQEIYGDGLTPRLTELSYDQPFAGGKADLYAGRINTENDFAASSAYWGGIALYCAYQNNAICGTPIDSGYVAYPTSVWGARLKVHPSAWFMPKRARTRSTRSCHCEVTGSGSARMEIPARSCRSKSG